LLVTPPLLGTADRSRLRVCVCGDDLGVCDQFGCFVTCVTFFFHGAEDNVGIFSSRVPSFFPYPRFKALLRVRGSIAERQSRRSKLPAVAVRKQAMPLLFGVGARPPPARCIHVMVALQPTAACGTAAMPCRRGTEHAVAACEGEMMPYVI
jgi:hypothetical protein